MSINEDGFCSGCRTFVLEHPRLVCPTCEHSRIAGVKADLGLDPDTDPERVILAVKGELREMARRRRELFAIRARACRVILRRGGPGIVEAAKLARSKVASIEKWAAADVHDGRLTPPVRRKRPTMAPEVRKERATLLRAWADYDKRLAAREAAMIAHDADSAPERLLPPLMPPEPRP